MAYESSRGIPRKNFLIFSRWSPMAFPCLKMKQIDFLSNKILRITSQQVVL